MKIILASGSPRRKELMEKTGLDFEIDPPDLNERAFTEESAKKLVETLALKKAEAVEENHPNSIIIGSDLTVAYLDRQIGKPEDEKDAKEILQLLRGKTHQVLTGVAVINTDNGQIATAVEEVEIMMKDYSDQEIDDYIATGEPMDKAGAYAVQGFGGKLVEKIEGDREVVIGLPTKTVLKLLSEVGYREELK